MGKSKYFRLSLVTSQSYGLHLTVTALMSASLLSTMSLTTILPVPLEMGGRGAIAPP